MKENKEGKREHGPQQGNRKEIPWADLEKRTRIGWIVLSVLLAVAIVIICIWQGATKSGQVRDAQELVVLHLADTFQNTSETPEIYWADSLEALRKKLPWKDRVKTVKDVDGQSYCKVYERQETGRLLYLGNYPILEQERAGQLLSEGRYFTNVPGDFPGEDAVVLGDLVYRDDGSKIVIPYYRFLLELPENEEEEKEEKDNTEKQYGAYYVPAVEGEYLDNLSIWHETE